MNRNLIFILILALIAAGLFALYGDKLTGTLTPQIPGESSQTEEVSETPTIGKNKITIENFAFNPQTITIKKGTAVTWTNLDQLSHNVADDPDEAVFKSQILSQGQSFTYTFQEAGEYNYYCPLHPSMKGKIIVE